MISFPVTRGIIAVGSALLLATTAAAQPPPTPSDHPVTISSMSFGELPSDLKVGDTITWINKDTVPHTVTARDHSFDLRLQPGASGKIILQKAGNIAFYCIDHSTMRGVLKVAG